MLDNFESYKNTIETQNRIFEMNKDKRMLLNGTLVRKTREKLGITLAKVTEEVLNNQNISLSTLMRIEKSDAFEAKQIQVDILSKALRTPSEGLLCSPSDTRVANVLMHRVTEGQQLISLIDNLHGSIWQIPSEPRTASARESILELCKHLDDMNGSYQDYPKKIEGTLSKLEKQFQLRNLLDRLSEDQVHVYVGKHYRFEAIVTEDLSDILYDPNGQPVFANAWNTCWAGVLERDWIEALEKAGNTSMENYGFRDLLAVTFMMDEEPSDSIISRFDVDPTNLLTKDNPNVRRQFEFWDHNANCVSNGEPPLTWDEFSNRGRQTRHLSKSD